jgi:hypothetical protein
MTFASSGERMNQEELVLADIARIQDYILSPWRLKLNRGASQIIRELNERVLRDLVDSLGGRVIYSNGGNVLAALPHGKSGRFQLEAERELRRRAETAVIRTAVCDYQSPNEFPVRYEEILEKMARLKGTAAFSDSPGSMPFWDPCGACGLYPAATWSRYESERRLCRACQLREEASDRYAVNWRRPLPEDFDDIAGCSVPAGYLALIYVDLDGMGDYFRRDATSEDRLGEVSDRIDDSVKAGVARACEKPRLCEVLLIGGDEAAVVVPAQCVFDFLAEFQAGFLEMYFKALDSGRSMPKTAPTFSAGVALAHSHFPISEFFRIATRLLRSAKRLRGQDSVDYEIISTSISGDPLENRDRVARLGAGRFRTAKPYPLKGFLDLANGVRQLKLDAPANKIKSLYRIAYRGLRQAELEYLYVLSRLDETSAASLRRLMGAEFWCDMPDGRTVTHAADIAELWEFV